MGADTDRFEFRVLGPFEVTVGGHRMNVGGPQIRGVLARLLVDAGRTVSVTALVEELWGAHAPADANRTARTYVSRLRKTLRQAVNGSHAELLVTSPPGYRLRVDRDSVDATRFERLAAEGRAALEAGQPRQALDRLTEALGLWRGNALAEFDDLPALSGAAARLDRLRLDVIEERIEAGLAVGLDSQLVGELQALVRLHPLRERLWGQLMLALYRSGRQAEALAAFREAREILIDEYAVEPSPRLVEMHQRILRQDPDLLPGPAPTPTAPPAAPSALPAPAQLPPRVLDFTGRTAEIAGLDSLLDTRLGARDTSGFPAVVISAVSGTAGVGKTALAVHWAHRVADRFPDGQLYVNLRGFDPASPPVEPLDAVRRFLEALDVPPDRIPDDLDARAALYRSRLAGRRMLVVLDNARDSAQVRPLLPGAPTCLVLVTSRWQLTGLVAAGGAYPVDLDLLTANEARELLARRLGAERVAAEPAAVDEIVLRCARLPLALAIVAARAATRPHLPLGTVAAELRDSRDRLDTLTTDDPNHDVRAVFSWSYRTLTPEATRLFRLLGLHPGHSIGAPAAASIAGIGPERVAPLLVELTRASLIVEPRPGRYACHDLLRAYAAELAHRLDSEAQRRAAIERVLEHYLHTAYAADRLIDPVRDTIALSPHQPGVTPEQLADQDLAYGWLEAEHSVLLATVDHAATAGWPTHAWQLGWSLATYLFRRGYWHDMAAVSRVMTAAAARLGDPVALARGCRVLANAYIRLSRFDDAEIVLRRGLELSRSAGDLTAQAHTHGLISHILQRTGSPVGALEHDQRAIELHRAAGNRLWEAEVRSGMGWSYALLGDYPRALEHCAQALTVMKQFGDRVGEAATWNSLGYAYHGLADHRRSVACYGRALALFQETGERYREAVTLHSCGDAHLAAGDPIAAGLAWKEALAIFDELHHAHAEQVRVKLGALP